jgi:hypothetical protein
MLKWACLAEDPWEIAMKGEVGVGPKEQFVGTWKLLSFEFRRADGGVLYPLGEDAVGRLMYDAKGNMSVHLMSLHRAPFAAKDQLKGTSEEIKSALEGFIAYFGSVDVNEEEGAVVHHVEGSLFPNLIGKDQKRFFKFHGSRLELTAPAKPWGGEPMTGVLIWERMG